MGKIRLLRNFSCLSMNVFAIQGISVAESIVSWFSILSPSRMPGMQTLVDGNRVEQERTSSTADWSWLKELRKKSSYFVSSEPTCCDRYLLLLATVANEGCGVSTPFNRGFCRVVVLLPSALAVTATVLVPSVSTVVTADPVKHREPNTPNSIFKRKIRTRLLVDLLSIPQSRGKNVKTFRWDHGLQIQNLYMVFKRVPRW